MCKVPPRTEIYRDARGCLFYCYRGYCFLWTRIIIIVISLRTRRITLIFYRKQYLRGDRWSMIIFLLLRCCFTCSYIMYPFVFVTAQSTHILLLKLILQFDIFPVRRDNNTIYICTTCLYVIFKHSCNLRLCETYLFLWVCIVY